MDEEITRLKTQLKQGQIHEDHIYNKACDFHDKMINNKLPQSDKNLNIHDRAILIIRRWRHKNMIFID